MRFLYQNYKVVLIGIIVSSSLFFGFSRYEYKIEKKDHELEGFTMSLANAHRFRNFQQENIEHLSKSIIKASRINNIDPLLVLAVISVESSFKRNAKSRVGARGLMQVMPRTAKAICKELGITYNGLNTIIDIETNIMIGTYYIAQLSKRFNGDMHKVLASYNFGPTKISSFIRNNKKLPKKYYKKVINEYKNFRNSISIGTTYTIGLNV